MLALAASGLDLGGDELGVVDHAVVVHVVALQDGVDEERQLVVIVDLWVLVAVTFVTVAICKNP